MAAEQNPKPTPDAEKTNYMKLLYCISILLVVVGAINWGASAQQSNLVEMFVPSQYTQYVYYLVAAAGVVVAYGWFTGGIACVGVVPEKEKETFEMSQGLGE